MSASCFEFSCEAVGRRVGFLSRKQHAAARFFSRSATQIFCAGNRAAGKQAPDVDHLVELHRGEDALQAARASALLHDEGNRERAFQFRRIDARRAVLKALRRRSDLPRRLPQIRRQRD